jgi:hypothetical protein
MNLPPCYIHIGAHKTGSSTLQQLIFDNRRLLAKHRVYWPAAGAVKFGHKHDDLVQELETGEGSDHRRAIIEEVSESGTPRSLLLSAERFCLQIHRREMRDRLAWFLEEIGYRGVIICYIRPQPALINSSYTQAVKMWTCRRPFDDYFDSALAEPSFDLEFRYNELARDSRFDTHFYPYNDSTLSEGLANHFLVRLGVPKSALAEFAFPELRNVSPGPKTVAALLAMGPSLPPRKLKSQEERFRSKTLARMIVAAGTELGWNGTKFNGLSADHLRRIEVRFGESNERFAQLVWKSSWVSMFGESDGITEPNEFDPASSSGTERREFFAMLDDCRSFCAALLKRTTSVRPST